MATGASKRSEEHKALEFVPVFCTAEVPTETLERFVMIYRKGTPNAENYRPVIMTTNDISSITAPSMGAPPEKSLNPFLNWTVDECYQFYLQNISDPGNEVSGEWTAHSFIVLDSESASDGRTCLLCSDVPDFLERERVVLKSMRAFFHVALEEAMCYETFVRRPSESGGGALGAGDVMTGEEDFMGLSVMPPLAFSPMQQRRQTISYGLTNDSIPEGRRYWDRYLDDSKKGKN